MCFTRCFLFQSGRHSQWVAIAFRNLQVGRPKRISRSVKQHFFCMTVRADGDVMCSAGSRTGEFWAEGRRFGKQRRALCVRWLVDVVRQVKRLACQRHVKLESDLSDHAGVCFNICAYIEEWKDIIKALKLAHRH